MHAVILAAGRGSRMGRLGEERPKCLIEFCKKPLIERQVAALQGGGAETVGIVCGYRADMIKVAGATNLYNQRWSETNMVMSLAAAAEWLRRDHVIVSYADIFYRHELVRDLAAAPGDLVVTYDRAWRSLWSRRFADPLADAESFRADASGRLVEIGNRAKSLDEIEGQYMGLLKFTPYAWTEAEALLASLDPHSRDHLDMTGLLQRMLLRDFAINTLPTTGQWGEIDNPDDLALYERMVRDGELILEG